MGTVSGGIRNMNKLIAGGAIAALLIAGQAVASRLPESPAVPAGDPKGAESVTTDPGVTPAVRAVDGLDPVTTPDPSGAALVGPLSEAETARLAVQTQNPAHSVAMRSLDISFQDEICGNGIDDDRNGLVDDRCGPEYDGYVGPQRNQIAPIVIGAAIVATAIVVVTDDDSDSN